MLERAEAVGAKLEISNAGKSDQPSGCRSPAYERLGNIRVFVVAKTCFLKRTASSPVRQLGLSEARTERRDREVRKTRPDFVVVTCDAVHGWRGVI